MTVLHDTCERDDPVIPPESPSVPTHRLRGVLRQVDLLLHRAVEAARLVYAPAAGGDPFRGLYVTETDAARSVARGVEPLGHGFAPIRPLIDPAAAGPQWERLVTTFELSPPEIDILALVLAPEIDLRYERILAYLQDDVSKRRPTADLLIQLLCQSFEERMAARRLFGTRGRLRRYGLLRPIPDPAMPAVPELAQPLRLDDGIVSLLLGEEEVEPRLRNALTMDWPGAGEATMGEQPALTDRLASEIQRLHGERRARLIVLGGPDDDTKRILLRAVAARLDAPLLCADLAKLARLEIGLDAALRLVARTARLYDGVLAWTAPAASSVDPGSELCDALDEVAESFGLCAQVIVAGNAEAVLCPRHAAEGLQLDFPLPSARCRAELWSRRLREAGMPFPDDELGVLADAFRIDRSATHRAVDAAIAAAEWRSPDSPRLDRADLARAARRQAMRTLPRCAVRIEPAFAWDDIVLPPDQLDQLREMCDRVRHRRMVFHAWGFGPRLALGGGVTALFAGPSGSGKTLAAQIVAATLGLELYRVDLPSVVSKYIGDTEKVLDGLFREAHGAGALLFFDEADALFGKRSEVRDAHDRYANIEISYLLQALEQYDGLTLLATNLRHNLDDAFIRRLSFCITFPFPEEPERRRLWAGCWPPATPVDDDVDVSFLARQFKLTGGNIRNIAVAAAFAAAADGSRVTMPHVIRGVRREYQKMGKACAESEFGPWFGALAARGRDA